MLKQASLSNRFDLEDFKYNQVNMTAFRIVDSDNEEVQRVLREMESISALGRAILNQSQVRSLIIKLN